MPVTLEDIKDLSDEVNALVKAGLPLEHHLADAGRGHGQRLQNLTRKISDRLAAGESIQDAVQGERDAGSRLLSATVAVGIRTGRLGDAIEMMGDVAADLIELRRRILQSIAYPFTVVLVAVLLFCVFVRAFLFRVHLLLKDPVDGGEIPFVQRLIDLDMEYWWWPLVLPVAGLVITTVWVASGRAALMAFRGPERVLMLLPGVAGMIRDLQFYSVSRMVSLLIQRQIPAADALVLAGACSGNSPLNSACRTAASDIEAGRFHSDHSERNWRPGLLPPLLEVGLQQQHGSADLFGEQLGRVAGYYRRRLNVSLSWLRNIVPLVLFVVLGGGTVFLYALTVIWPVVEIYRTLEAG